jgi:hypothetical protein
MQVSCVVEFVFGLTGLESPWGVLTASAAILHDDVISWLWTPCFTGYLQRRTQFDAAAAITTIQLDETDDVCPPILGSNACRSLPKCRCDSDR